VREFRGKVAVVTGAASGIGFACAKLLAREGMPVALLDVREREVDAAAQQIIALGGRALALATDVADERSVASVAERISAEFGKVHLLVNNAAVFVRGGELVSVVDELWDWLLGVNLYGAIHCLRSFVPRMRAHGEGGHIVMMASISGFVVGDRQNGVYCASKFALVALAEALAHDLADSGVGVSVVLPAAVATGFYENSAQLRGARGGLNLFPSAPPDTAAGMSADEVAARMLEGVREERFYIATHVRTRALIEERHRALMAAFDAAERFRGGS